MKEYSIDKPIQDISELSENGREIISKEIYIRNKEIGATIEDLVWVYYNRQNYEEKIVKSLSKKEQKFIRNLLINIDTYRSVPDIEREIWIPAVKFSYEVIPSSAWKIEDNPIRKYKIDRLKDSAIIEYYQDCQKVGKLCSYPEIGKINSFFNSMHSRYIRESYSDLNGSFAFDDETTKIEITYLDGSTEDINCSNDAFLRTYIGECFREVFNKRPSLIVF